MKFKGKVSGWFYVLVAGIALFYLFWIVLFSVLYPNVVVLTIILASMVVLEGFCVPILLHNFVQLQQQELLIAFGWIQKRIPYKEIVSLSDTNNPTSSLAASLDRIEIKCKNGKSVMIALNEKERFFEEMKTNINCLKTKSAQKQGVFVRMEENR